MQTWGVNAVRVPLNEDCRLGTKPGLDPQWTGAAYRQAMTDYVATITGRGLVAIVDLHRTAPAGETAHGQDPIANMDHSPAFWSQVATAFHDDGLVLFELFNEPYLERDPCRRSVELLARRVHGAQRRPRPAARCGHLRRGGHAGSARRRAGHRRRQPGADR